MSARRFSSSIFPARLWAVSRSSSSIARRCPGGRLLSNWSSLSEMLELGAMSLSKIISQAFVIVTSSAINSSVDR